MRKPFTAALVLGLFLSLAGHVSAQELYVRNRPFKGATSKLAGQLWVELTPFAKAIDAQVGEAEAGLTVLTLGETSVEIPVQTVEGTVMVSLPDVAEKLGARLSENKDFGTIDFHILPPSGGSTADAGAWGKNLEQGAAGKTTASKPQAKSGSGSVLRLYGKVTLDGADQVGLFEGGSATVPYKVGRVDKDGNYTLEIDLEKDTHEQQPGVRLTDIRFFKEGAFEACHGRCNFLYYVESEKKLVLMPYGTNQQIPIDSMNFKFEEQY